MGRNTPLDITNEGSEKRHIEIKSITLDGNNTTKAHRVFTVTGHVKIKALYGIVTTALGSNLTAAYLRTNDQTATLPITAAAGTAISSLPVGSKLTRHSLVAVAIKADSAAAAKVVDPVAATAPDVYMPFTVVQKTGNVQTDIEFVYTTTNAPTSGVIKFYAIFEPLTPESDLRAV